MSTINGYILNSPLNLNGDLGVTSQLSEFSNEFNVELISGVSGIIGGLLDNNQPVNSLPQSELNGSMIQSFGSLFFNKIHVIPTVINVGNLANKQIREIEIFNAYISESAHLESVTESGDLSGINFDIVDGIDFAPLESRVFDLTINTAGSPVFSGQYIFEFTDKPAPDLSVSGRRIILFPFSHNWVNPVKEVLQYLTQIYESRADFEQAQQLRPFPRRLLTYFHTPIESSELKDIAENRAELEALSYLWINRIFALPIWEDVSVLSHQLNSGDTEILLDTRGLDFDIGSYLVIWKSSKEFELIEIGNLTDSSIELSREIDSAYQPGVLILPARLARLNSEIEFSGNTEETLQLETEWMLEPNQESIHRIGTWATDVYRGFPVYLDASRLDESIKIQLKSKQIVSDYQVGARSILTMGRNPRTSFSAFRLNINRLESRKFYKFLDDRNGKLSPCWYSTWSKDFTIIETAAAGANSLSVRGNRFSNNYGFDYDNFGLNRRDIMIRWNDGTIFYTRITGSAPIDGNSEALLIDGIFPKELTISQLDRISFLKLARFESDNIEIIKETSTISHISMPLRELVSNE